MKILTIHNKYQLRGGEDEVQESEEHLLLSRGHQVRSVIFDNAGLSGFGAVRAGCSAVWSRAAYNRVSREIASWHPDILNVHNFFPRATPAVHHAAARSGVPVVQTLHNFRPLCPGSVLFRDGALCERCLGKVVPWSGVFHRCYRGSYPASAAVAATISVHNLLKTWQKQVALFFALTEFSRRKFIEGGFPPDRLVVKPNFAPFDRGPGSGDGDYVFYAGRLTDEKGIPLLLNAWRAANAGGRLLIAGEGPLASLVQKVSARDDSIHYLGRLPLEEIHQYMGGARAFVFPSLWYEGLPRVIIEAFSRGTPVIANRLGSMAELIRDKETGWLVEPGDCTAFAATLAGVLRDGCSLTGFRSAARAEFERKYTAARQYDLLMTAYGQAIETYKHGHLPMSA
jgi:glycosyltransferase involved in cell wall biosynthesis